MRDEAIYLVAGLGMIVGAFFSAAKALGGLLALLFFLFTTDFSNVDPSLGDNLSQTIKTTHVSSSVQGIASFLILFFGGRWILSKPAIIEKWRRQNNQN